MILTLLALGLSAVLAQPFAPGQGVLPSGASVFVRVEQRFCEAQCH